MVYTAAVAESDCCFKRQLPAQFGKELCAQTRFANDKRACGAHVHGIVDAQFFGEHARTKSPVSSNVDTPEENDQSHAAIVAAPKYRGEAEAVGPYDREHVVAQRLPICLLWSIKC